MDISVIIPVYNAADYVRQAVESALVQPETVEILLVDDNSSDNSLVVCQELCALYPNVHLYHHPDGKNHGAAATRNIALAKSTCEYIAFLDADDYYLPGRFSLSHELFKADPKIDGVYEALGEHIENEMARTRWINADRSIGKLTTMRVRVPSDELYEVLVAGAHGYFHLDGLTVKRSVFIRTGLFNERLRLHEDTDMIWKMAAMVRLMPGRLEEPVALRRIHEHNTISTPRAPSEVYSAWRLFMKEVWQWSCTKLTRPQLQVLRRRYLKEKRAFFWKQPLPSHFLITWNGLLKTYGKWKALIRRDTA